MIASIIASVVGALVLGIVSWVARRVTKALSHYASASELHGRVTEACELSARAVVAATRAEASAKRTEERVNTLLLALGRNLDS